MRTPILQAADGVAEKDLEGEEGEDDGEDGDDDVDDDGDAGDSMMAGTAAPVATCRGGGTGVDVTA